MHRSLLCLRAAAFHTSVRVPNPATWANVPLYLPVKKPLKSRKLFIKLALAINASEIPYLLDKNWLYRHSALATPPGSVVGYSYYADIPGVEVQHPGFVVPCS
jgi:hypothetical protein